MPSIFSYNGATAARDGLGSCTLPPLPCIHLAPPLPPLVPCFSISLLLSDLFFFSLILPLPYCLIQAHTPPTPTPLSFSRALSPQSRFASYFEKPLKASHFRIFHSRAAQKLCHSPGREHTRLLADTHHRPAHTHTHAHTLFDSHVRPEPATADNVPARFSVPFTNKPSRDGIC